MLDFEEGNNKGYNQGQSKDKTFCCEPEDPSRAHAQRVQAWAQKWERGGLLVKIFIIGLLKTRPDLLSSTPMLKPIGKNGPINRLCQLVGQPPKIMPDGLKFN